MSKPIDLGDLRDLVREMVHVAVEGSGECLIDLTAQLARMVDVPYDVVECRKCGGWADAATSHGARGLCDGCDDFNGPVKG